MRQLQDHLNCWSSGERHATEIKHIKYCKSMLSRFLSLKQLSTTTIMTGNPRLYWIRLNTTLNQLPKKQNSKTRLRYYPADSYDIHLCKLFTKFSVCLASSYLLYCESSLKNTFLCRVKTFTLQNRTEWLLINGLHIWYFVDILHDKLVKCIK